MSHNRSASSNPAQAIRLIVALLGVLLLHPSGTAQAGSFVEELRYRYQCFGARQPALIQYGFLQFPVSVGIIPTQDPSLGTLPILVVNEREAFSADPMIVAFDYFSACEQARQMERYPWFDHQVLLRNIDAMNNIVLAADCRAMAIMRGEGMLGGSRGFYQLFEYLAYYRGDATYYGVSFATRADNIRRCAF